MHFVPLNIMLVDLLWAMGKVAQYCYLLTMHKSLSFYLQVPDMGVIP